MILLKAGAVVAVDLLPGWGDKPDNVLVKTDGLKLTGTKEETEERN